MLSEQRLEIFIVDLKAKIAGARKIKKIKDMAQQKLSKKSGIVKKMITKKNSYL